MSDHDTTSTNNVLLREYRPEDFTPLAAIRRNKTLQHLLLAHPSDSSISDEDVRAWILRRAGDPDGCFYVISDALEGPAFGFAQIVGIHHKGGFGYFGMALAPEARGRGLGTAALRSLCEISKTRGLRKLLAEVRTDNAASLALCHAVGFLRIGVLQRHYGDHGVVLLEKLL